MDNYPPHTKDIKLIDLEIGEILHGEKFRTYKVKKDEKGNIKIYNILPSKMRTLLFILIFGIVGPLLTLFFHKKCFDWFHQRIGDDYISPHTYRKLSNNIMSRIILFIISLLISLNTTLIFLYKLIEFVGDGDEEYDWGGLYESLKKNGYTPTKYKLGYIQVEKFKNNYICIDGNHRLLLLSYLYSPHKKIKVKFIGRTYREHTWFTGDL